MIGFKIDARNYCNKKVLFLVIILGLFIPATAQYKVLLLIKSSEENQPLAGATAVINAINKTAIADSRGIAAFGDLPRGTYTVRITHIGFSGQELSFAVPQDDGAPILVLLAETEAQEEEVIVVSTRSSRTISDLPTRVETISGEELTEKGNMKPGDIRMLLNESTGIQTQQTSATSYNSSIRIQGLDGRYTQVLRDGFPLYGGFSGGLSLMQVAPLDLKQIEVIKGSSSTLYGGGAIAGLVNLISKTPAEKRELSFLGNGTSAGGFDGSGFYSQKFNRLGVTVFGSGNTGRAYDPAGIGLTAIPEFTRYTLHPTLFFYADKTSANIGFSYMTENRLGGSMDYIRKATPGFFERNQTNRLTTQAGFSKRFNDRSGLQLKNSYSHFRRSIQIPGFTFNGLQQSTFSEATYSSSRDKTDWVIGANFLTDDFKEDQQSNQPVRNYRYNTVGAFIQNTWCPTRQFRLETGLRTDYTRQYGMQVLPRISAMVKLNARLTARLGGGLGYKTPTVFNEEAERIQFQNILPINQNSASNERSAGGNFDLNFRTSIGATGVAINQLFFYTRLNHPLLLVPAGINGYAFENASGNIDTKGIETNIRLKYDRFTLFLGYTYADVNTHFNNNKSWYPLTARHRLNNVLMYELEGKIKIGAEAYYFSPQKLTDDTIGKSYWTFGMMGEKSWNGFALFINFENLGDTRQTKWDTIYQGTIDHPVFKDIYAPVDGFVVNGGLKWRL